ncbi:MAG: type II toxin-antitoxin system Phd/YefM family antitoxin [Spirochaetales bacterium]|nr:type II toxin-antitoxin system Phd/YefM family antitoxin [Spirochaetales bacterium]MCF7937900.1 type II toxin-antitoxin system Phd/YefM family antitoxin [Spirochaetales bacterium]
MKTMGIFEIKTHLSRVCEDVAQTGESVLITRRGKPFVQIAPLENEQKTGSSIWNARDEFLESNDHTDDFLEPDRRVDPFYSPFETEDPEHTE